MNEMLKQLKDIKPPVAVPDDSLWITLGLAALAVLIVAVATLVWYKRRPLKPIRRRKDPKAEAKEKLGAIDYGDTKSAVYTFGEYLPLLIYDQPELMEAFEALQKELEPYKYKKAVPPLQKRHIKKMEALVKKGLKHG